MFQDFTPEELEIWNRGRHYRELRSNAGFMSLYRELQNYVAEGHNAVANCYSNDEKIVLALVRRSSERRAFLNFIDKTIQAGIESANLLERTGE